MLLNRVILAAALVAAAGCDDQGGDDGGGDAPDAATGGGDATVGEPDAAPPAPDAAPVMAIDVDFEGAELPPGVDPGNSTLTPSQGYAALGTPGNQFGPTFLRGSTGNTVTITLDDMTPHSAVDLDFLFAAIDSLDGTGSFPAGDFFRVTVDGVEVFRESFANAEPSQIQSYVAPPGGELARRVDLGFQGPGGFYTDSAYDMSVEPKFDAIPHTGSTITITFTLEGEGVQPLEDESWAIDNLRVTLLP